LEPPKFRHKRLPKGPPSPPPPVLHSPPRKVTVKEQNEWKIPPCISNWKNPKGYTIPLDKRLAADGRGLQEVQVNDNFAKLAHTLQVADKQAREEITRRQTVQTKLAQKEKEMKEEKLRQIAAQARDERAGLALKPSRTDVSEEAEGERDRDRLRREKQKEIEREMRMNNMGKEAKSKLHRDVDRDVSEKIALGLAAPTMSKDMMFDQRLFNQASSASAVSTLDDEAYTLYDKPLFSGSSANSIYKHRKDKGDEVDEKANKRSGPVEFEKEEADPFGLDQFMTDAKKGKRARTEK